MRHFVALIMLHWDCMRIRHVDHVGINVELGEQIKK